MADLPVSMHNGGVIPPAEGLADFWQRELGELAAEVHGDLAGVNQNPAAARSTEVLQGKAEIGGGLGHNR